MSPYPRELALSLRAGLAGPKRPGYKDPFGPDYLGARATVTQREVWPHIRDTFGIKAAVIGGKGAAKTTTAGGFLLDRVQKYPGSKWFVAAYTYSQAFESCAYQLVKAAKMMQLPYEYRERRTIDSMPHRFVYYFPDYESSVCIRSAENIDDIEGSEWDGGVIEEIQLWKQRDVNVALDRIRRGVGDHSHMIVGLPEDEEAWFYAFLEENKYLLREVDTRENADNLRPGYIEELLSRYPGAEGERYVSGKRVSLHRMPVQSAYRSEIHKNSDLSKRLCHYDPNRPLYICFDFNVAPGVATLWQVKPVEFRVVRKNALNQWSRAKEFKEVICQVDEFEGWRIGTKGICQMILERYGEHTAGGVATGDAKGNASDTRTVSETDWTIIREYLGKLPDMVIRQGLIINRRKSSSPQQRRNKTAQERLAKYDNPPLKDSIENFNRVLLDGDGDPGMLFLPQSRYESGGCAASVMSVKYKADGSVDESPDKQTGTSVRRTHFWATARYISWFLSPPGKPVRDLRVATRRSTSYEPQSDRIYRP